MWYTVYMEYNIYLVGNQQFDWYKIGISGGTVGQRLRTLDSPLLPFILSVVCDVKIYEPLKVARHVERLVHDFYAPKRVRGEWFHHIDKHEFLKIVTKSHKAAKKRSVSIIAVRPQRTSKKHKGVGVTDKFSHPWRKTTQRGTIKPYKLNLETR